MESGLLIINKPAGPSSHWVINQLRKITGIKKIGHAGTLDPFASGVLVCAVSREATRDLGLLVGLDKEYDVILKLGEVSDTGDRTGKISNFPSFGDKQFPISNKIPNELPVQDILRAFVGKQKQVPPMFSAKKVGGRKLYELARKGIEIERQPAAIEIYSINMHSYDWPILKINVHCSSGTYIRTLGEDIGRVLGCGAYVQGLERTAVGQFRLENGIRLAELEERGWKDCMLDPRSFPAKNICA